MILRHFQPKQKDGGRPNGYRVLSNQYKMTGFAIYHPKLLSLVMTLQNFDLSCSSSLFTYRLPRLLISFSLPEKRFVVFKFHKHAKSNFQDNNCLKKLYTGPLNIVKSSDLSHDHVKNF